MTTDVLHRFHQRALTWAETAKEAGWLPEREVERLRAVEAATPAELFGEENQRPLVVAFFGGTGVGKSSLLNRLAGQPVARTGVERPTSREVTLYLHESVSVQHLPEEFPVDKVKIALHRQESNRDILWIDMPDIDSVDTENRELVLDWLPHIDLLIYVVSPERYRDDRGWRLLLEHGHRHAWLFVINQWDKGDPAQREDFVRLLKEAGFREPLVFCTDSREGVTTDDDFEQLAQTIRSLANAHTVRQLQIRGISLRMEELRGTLRAVAEKVGAEDAFPALEERWREIWQKTAGELEQGLEWKIDALAERFAPSREPNLLRRNEAPAATSAAEPDSTGDEIWDAWAHTRLEDALDSLVVEADALGIPTAPLRKRLAAVREQTRGWMENHLQLALRAALRKPGTALQRLLYRTTGLLAGLLPILALVWVGYRLFTGYYQSAVEPSHYLGIDFAIHSVLLVLTAWLLPYLAHRKLRPSLQKAARRGLQAGLAEGLTETGHRVEKALEELQTRQRKLLRECQEILDEFDHRRIALPVEEAGEDDALSRLLTMRNAAVPP